MQVLKDSLRCNVRNNACQHDRGEGADREIEEDDLEREEHAADRRAEDRADSRGGSAADEHGQMGSRQLKELSDAGTNRGADLDDRPFRAGRSAGTDRDRAGADLLERDQGPDTPAAAENGFDHIDNAMPFAA